jgi:hypothetical protein
MPRLTVRPEAELDALDAGAWYDGERVGLGTEFLTELRATFSRIEDGPQRSSLSSSVTSGARFSAGSPSACFSSSRPRARSCSPSRTFGGIRACGKDAPDAGRSGCRWSRGKRNSSGIQPANYPDEHWPRSTNPPVVHRVDSAIRRGQKRSPDGIQPEGFGDQK